MIDINHEFGIASCKYSSSLYCLNLFLHSHEDSFIKSVTACVNKESTFAKASE
jgi:hypothetical protein